MFASACLLLPLVGLGLQNPDLSRLPIPVQGVESPFVKSQLVHAEKLLAKSDFAGAKQCVSFLAVNDVRWSLDASAAPAAERPKIEKAVAKGLAIWSKALGDSIKVNRVSANSNLVFRISKGYSVPFAITSFTENGKFGCEEFDVKGGAGTPRKFVATLFLDRGPEGSVHDEAEFAHLAARALGTFLGLHPINGPIGLMGGCRHVGPPQNTPLDREKSVARSTVVAADTISRYAAEKHKIRYTAPEITVTSDSVDFGVQSPGTVEKTIAFKNVGTASLRIATISGDCKCVATEWDPDVAPGGTGKIKAKIDAQNMYGDTVRHLNIMSNDPETPVKIVTMRLVVMRTVAIEPVAATINLPMDGEGGTDFFVYSPKDIEFQVTKVLCSLPSIKATFERGKRKFSPSHFPNLKEEERDGYVVKVVTPTKLEFGGPYSIFVNVATDSNADPSLRFQLTAYKGVRMMPTGTTIVDTRNPEEDKRGVAVEWENHPFKITGVDTSPPELAAQVETVAAGHKYRIWLTPKPGLEPHAVKKIRVLVYTDCPQQPKIEYAAWLMVRPLDTPSTESKPEGAR